MSDNGPIEYDENGEPIVGWGIDDSGNAAPVENAFGNASTATPLDKIREFVALQSAPPAEPAAPTAFSRAGRDYYVAPDGKLLSVETGFDAVTEYPGLQPATEEQVHARDIQKRSGGVIDQVETFGHTAAATAVETASGLYNVGRNLTTNFYGPDSNVRAKDVVPGLFGQKEVEQREANPTAAFLGAAVPDLAINAIPGAGPAAQGARILASSIVTEAGNTVIEGDEFDMADAFGVYAPLQGALEIGGAKALGGAARALGWTRNAVNNVVERAQTTAARDALREVDPVKQASKLRKSAATVYKQAQAKLDDALSAIDERVGAAPDKLFTPSALKKTVSNNINAQVDAVQNLATQLEHAGEVTGTPALQQAAKALDGVRGSSGHVLYGTLRQVAKLFEEGASDNPLAREAIELLEKTLADEGVWGKAARNHLDALQEVARAIGPQARHQVADVAGREALDARLETARRVASLTGDKKLAAAAERAAEALGEADKVTGARLMAANATGEEVVELRKMLDAFPDQAPEIVARVGKAIDAIDEVAPGALSETWTAERIERHIAERAAGSKVARKQFDAQLDQADKWLTAQKRGKLLPPAKIARAEQHLQRIRDALDKVDEVHKAFKTVRDVDAAPRNLAEKAIDAVTGKVATTLASRAASTVAGTAAGYAGGGTVGGMIGFAGGEAFNRYLEPLVQARATKFAKWLKDGLRKHGGTGAGVVALYGANRLAYDEDDPSPEAAAAVGLLGLPLLFSRGRPAGLLHAMRELDERLKPLRGSKQWVDWYQKEPILNELFGSHDAPGAILADRALEAIKQRERFTGKTFDLNAPGAEKLIERELNDHWFGALPEKVAPAKQAFSKEKARLTRETRKAGDPKKAKARATLGELGRRLDGATISSARRDDLIEQLTKRVKDPAPLTIADVQKNILRLSEDVPPDWHGEWVWDPVQATSVRSTPKTDAELAAYQTGQRQKIAEAMGPLQVHVDEALKGIDPEDKVARVTAENDAIRSLMRDALGMRPAKKGKALDPSIDATSRYRKNKRGFDEWRRKALEENEREATFTWQSMAYRDLNEAVRDGRVLGKKPAATAKALGITSELQAALNKAVDAGWAVPGRVTRGVAMPQSEVDKLLKAKTVTAQGFMSTSIHSGTPKGFAQRRAKEYNEVPVILTIEQRTGVPLGQGEGELTLRPGTKFAVEWAQPADHEGFVTAYLKEVEPSTVTPKDVLMGLAGKIPTEAKVAGGLLAIDQVIGDDDEDDEMALAAGAGALAFLFPRAAMRLRSAAFEEIAEHLITKGTKEELPEIIARLKSGDIELPASERMDLLEILESPKATGPVTNADVMVKRVSDARGSNRGGVFVGSDGRERYVKLYRQPQQAVGEDMANAFYTSAGLDAPRSLTFEGQNGKVGFASEMVDGWESLAISEITPDQAQEFAKGFWHDVLMANWDVVGMHHDNLLFDRYGHVMRVDNGSALKYRAQGAPKPPEALESLAEIDRFFDRNGNRSYAELMKVAGYTNPRELMPELQKAIADGHNYLANPGPDADPELLDIFRKRLELLEGYERQNKPQRPRLQLGDVVQKESLPDYLDHTERSFARNYILEPIRLARRERPGGMGWLDGSVEQVEGQIARSLNGRFFHPESSGKRLALERFAREQVEMLRKNNAIIETLDTPPPVKGYLESSPDVGDVQRHIEQAEAQLTPAQREAIADFTTEWSSRIKSAERGDPLPTDRHELDSQLTAMTKSLDLAEAARTLLYKEPTRHGALFRGLNLPEPALHELLTLDTFTPLSTLSTSHKEAMAGSFTHGAENKVLLRFQHVNEAAPVFTFSRAGEEQEWFIPKGGAFDVVGRYFDPKQNKFIIDLAQRSPAEAVDLAKAGALAVAVGVGATAEYERRQQQQQAEQDDQDEADRIISEAKAEAAGIDEGREQQLDETRNKLAFISHQGRQLMSTAARALTRPSNDNARTVETVPGMTASAGVARFLGSNPSLEDAFTEKRQTLESIQQNPMALVEELAESYGELAEAAPELHAQVTAQTFKVAQYITSKIPSTIGPSLMRPEGTPPNRLAIRQFALYYSAATDPSSVLTDVANNRVTKQQVTTLQEVWPQTYDRLKLAMLEELTNGKPTVSQRARIDLLFDFGPNVDRAFSPRLVAALEQHRAAKGPQGGEGAQAGKQAPSRRSQPSIVGTSATPQLMGPAAGPGVMA